MKTTKQRPNRDHVRRTNRPTPSNDVIEERIRSLVQPAVNAQLACYQTLGLRNRILTLPVMVASILMMLWRDITSVRELTRCLASEDYFWGEGPLKVSQQALSKRFLEFPAELFQKVFAHLLPTLRQRNQMRSRPIPKAIAEAKKHFDRVLAVDCSTLEALFRKLDALHDVSFGQLAGKICALVDVETRLPEHFFFSGNAKASDFSFLAQLTSYVQAACIHERMLLIFDRGFHDYSFYDQLSEKGAAWITRPKSNDAIQTHKVLRSHNGIFESIVRIGSKDSQNGQAKYLIRLIEVKVGSNSYRYITSVLDPHLLTAEQIAPLYAQRWRIEEVFCVSKRLLHLSYLWTGSLNGIELQIWATLLYFAVLVDLSDEIADGLQVPFMRVSLEMVHRSLFYFIQAAARGKASDPVSFLVEHCKLYGIIKALDRRQRLPEFLPPLPC